MSCALFCDDVRS